MKKLYLDRTEIDGCTAVFVSDAQVINAGTTMYAMPVKDKDKEYERFAEEFDIHFIFADAVPVIDFFAVPEVNVFATDSAGGYLGSVGQCMDPRGDTSICYIDRERNCCLAAANFKEFVQNAANWKHNLTPYSEIKLYASRLEAEKELEFISLSDFSDEV